MKSLGYRPRMSEQYAIAALTRKRAELAGKIDRQQPKLVNLLSDLKAVDCALGLFDPTIELSEIVMKALPPRKGAVRGQMTILVLNILREADGPPRTEKINLRLMERRGLSTADKPLVRMMLQRVHSCLWNRRKHGRVNSRKGSGGKFSLWEIS